MSLIAQDTKDAIIERFARHVSSGKAGFFSSVGLDFVFGRREGAYVWDISGEQRLIDCHCNGGVFNLGHRNPRVVAALQQALQELDIGNHHFISEHRALLAERLTALCPGDLKRVVFGVSGGEAIDMAIKLARAHTRRPKIIFATGGYHGHTGFALAAGDAVFSAPFGPLAPGFVQVPFGDLAALEAEMNDQTAAVLFETIPATMGIVVPPEDFFAGVRRLCDQHGVVMITDEVQTGLGRCGAVWGIDTYGVIPDILVTAKGLSGGIYPITATVYREHLDPFLQANPFIHVSTFGGAEVGCYAALEVLTILQEAGFLEHVRTVAALFGQGFVWLKERHPAVLVETRQRGLMMGIKTASAQFGPLLTLAGFQHGLLTIYANHDQAVNQLLPPLTIQENEAQQVIEILDKMLTWLEGAMRGWTS
jgi:putrescine aminotransferase